MVKELNPKELKIALDAKEPMLIDFWAPWCPPCRMLAPELEKLATMTTTTIVKVDIEAFPQVAAEWGVQSIPTLVLTKGGKEVDRLSGYAPATALKARLAL